MRDAARLQPPSPAGHPGAADAAPDQVLAAHQGGAQEDGGRGRGDEDQPHPHGRARVRVRVRRQLAAEAATGARAAQEHHRKDRRIRASGQYSAVPYM